jgi:hypothetical protein
MLEVRTFSFCTPTSSGQTAYQSESMLIAGDAQAGENILESIA